MRYTNTHLEGWDDNEIIKAKLNDVTTTNSSTTSIGPYTGQMINGK